MLPAILGKARHDHLSILLLGAHADDIEIGCGGTVLELAAGYSDLAVHWVVLSAEGERAREAEQCAAKFLQGVPASTIVIETFRDGYFPYDGRRTKEYFEELKAQVSPDVIFTHYRDDWHQDHRLVGELTWNTWRDHLILEYEIPKYDPDLGSPNVFVPLSDQTAQAKVDYLVGTYRTQSTKRWFTRETFNAIMRLRGVASQSNGYAEGFYTRKLVMALTSSETTQG